MSCRSAVRIALAGVLVVLVIATGVACGRESGSPGDITVTSSVDSGHSHDVTIASADIDSPPAADKTIDTTYAGGHLHTITLMPQDYALIGDGGEVTVTSSRDAGHTHTFAISK